MSCPYRPILLHIRGMPRRPVGACLLDPNKAKSLGQGHALTHVIGIISLHAPIQKKEVLGLTSVVTGRANVKIHYHLFWGGIFH